MGDKLTPEEALILLEAQISNGDIEMAHVEADAILIALLRFYNCPKDIIEIYEKLPKWYA